MTTPDIQFIDNKKPRNRKGHVTLYMRITIQGQKPIDKSTGISINPSEWNYKKQIVKNGNPNATIFNDQLNDLRNQYYTYAKDIYLKTGSLNREDLIQIRNNSLLTNNFNDFFKIRLDDKLKRNEIKLRTYTRAKSTYNKLVNYQEHISFYEITQVKFIEDFIDHVKTTYDNKENSLIKAKAQLRAIIKDAIDKKLIKQEDNPFDRNSLKVGVMKSEKFESLSLKQLKQLEDFNPTNPTHQKTKDFFLFSCYTGLAHGDYSELSFEDIIVKQGDYYIKSNRKKTGSLILLPLDRLFPVPNRKSKPVQILEKYMHKYEPLKALDKKQRRFFSLSNQKMNEYIKEVCKAAKIESGDRISTHWGRHTFGTLMCNDFRVQITIVKELMSHSKIEQTVKYVRVNSETVNAVLDKTNWKI